MDSKETRERMRTGRLYYESGSDLGEEQAKCLELLYDFNPVSYTHLRAHET